LTPTIDVNTEGLTNLCTDGCQSLCKFWRRAKITRQSLMVEALQLLDLA
jgi:hypothetical protein